MAGTVVVVQKLGIGSVPPESQAFSVEMLDRFLHTLEGPALRPTAICFCTDGVRAACQGSAYLLGLQLLEGAEVKMLVCRTCLEHFGLADQLTASSGCVYFPWVKFKADLAISGESAPPWFSVILRDVVN